MTGNIPEWALHEAAQIWCEENHSAKEMNSAMVDSIARALAATAARVELERMSADLASILGHDETGWPIGTHGIVWHVIAPEIASLPLKYQETDNG